MTKQPQKNAAQKLRSWRASLIRKRARVLGDVKAQSHQEAEAAAIQKFNLSPEQRSRLVVQARVARSSRHRSGPSSKLKPAAEHLRGYLRRNRRGDG